MTLEIFPLINEAIITIAMAANVNRVSITMGPELLSKVDLARGDVSRSRFIARRLEDALKEVRKK